MEKRNQSHFSSIEKKLYEANYNYTNSRSPRAKCFTNDCLLHNEFDKTWLQHFGISQYSFLCKEILDAYLYFSLVNNMSGSVRRMPAFHVDVVRN